MAQPNIQHYTLPASPDESARQLTGLGKLYIDKDSKFGSKMYEILSTKLLILFDFCGKIGLKEDQYLNAFSSMLKDRANQFCNDHMANKLYNITKIVESTRFHFEAEANKQEYLTLWITTALHKMKIENPDKKTSECFQIMINILQKIQRGLWGSYYIDQNIRYQVLDGC